MRTFISALVVLLAALLPHQCAAQVSSNATRLRGVPLSPTKPSDGQALCYAASTKSWTPAACTNSGPTGPKGDTGATGPQGPQANLDAADHIWLRPSSGEAYFPWSSVSNTGIGKWGLFHAEAPNLGGSRPDDSWSIGWNCDNHNPVGEHMLCWVMETYYQPASDLRQLEYYLAVQSADRSYGSRPIWMILSYGTPNVFSLQFNTALFLGGLAGDDDMTNWGRISAGDGFSIFNGTGRFQYSGTALDGFLLNGHGAFGENIDGSARIATGYGTAHFFSSTNDTVDMSLMLGTGGQGLRWHPGSGFQLAINAPWETIPVISGSVAANDCAKFVQNGTYWKLASAGAACGSGGGGIAASGTPTAWKIPYWTDTGQLASWSGGPMGDDLQLSGADAGYMINSAKVLFQSGTAVTIASGQNLALSPNATTGKVTMYLNNSSGSFEILQSSSASGFPIITYLDGAYKFIVDKTGKISSATLTGAGNAPACVDTYGSIYRGTAGGC